MKGFIDRRINFFFRKTVKFEGTASKELFQFPRHRGPAFRGWNPLRRNGGNADFLVRRNRAAQKLFDSGPDGGGQLTCLSNRDVLHGWSLLLILMVPS